MLCPRSIISSLYLQFYIQPISLCSSNFPQFTTSLARKQKNLKNKFDLTRTVLFVNGRTTNLSDLFGHPTASEHHIFCPSIRKHNTGSISSSQSMLLNLGADVSVQRHWSQLRKLLRFGVCFASNFYAFTGPFTRIQGCAQQTIAWRFTKWCAPGCYNSYIPTSLKAT